MLKLVRINPTNESLSDSKWSDFQNLDLRH
jgi:hypothetical protein